MKLYTNAKIAECTKLGEERLALQHKFYQADSSEEAAAAQERIKEIDERIKTFTVINELDQAFATLFAYVNVYKELRSDIVSMSANGIDEILSVAIDVSAAITKTDEFLAANAAAAHKVYMSYINAGFSEEQAFALTSKMQDRMHDAIQQSMNRMSVK